MSEFIYTVSATFSDELVAKEWIAWLRGGHMDEVLREGSALEAEITRLDRADHCYDVRYRFASRESFEAYERHHAPRLRAEGISRFPPERGIVYRRSTGTILSRCAGNKL